MDQKTCLDHGSSAHSRNRFGCFGKELSMSDLPMNHVQNQNEPNTQDTITIHGERVEDKRRSRAKKAIKTEISRRNDDY
jgi:hypothetical protein